MRPLLIATAAVLAATALAPAAAVGQLDEGNIIVADPGAFGGDGGLIAVDPDSGVQTPISNNQISSQKLFSDPTGVTIDAEGRIIVADPNAFGGTGGLIEVDASSGQQRALSSNAISGADLFQDPVGVAVTPSGWLAVADSGAYGGGGGVISVDPDTGQQGQVSNNATSPVQLFVDPFGIAVERNGTIVVSDPASPAPVSGTTGAVIAVDPSNGDQRAVSSNDGSQAKLFSQPLGIAVETPGTFLVANTSADPAANGVLLASRFSGQHYGLATGAPFAAPTGIAMDLDGRALVADAAAFGGGGGVIRVHPVTGSRTTLSGDPSAAVALLADPSGLVVVPPTCQGRFATITGTDAADALTGTPEADVIAARDGDDIVDGKGGADLICGGKGRDRLVGNTGRDRILGGNSGDVILGKNGRDFIKGERGNDKVHAGNGNDRVFGQQRRDNLVGGKGRDRLSGGPGRDKLTGGPGRDRLRGGPGKDLQEQ